ncbi:hypothetical protein [Marinobacter caseinilyticus]|uniref:hypothetical protein n=1 Tax=Marinobacter caseinilyticus TaxID=2692195 RepID=UPI00140808BC|nr:hypothetical protein [Marinobacter caseinilyticus]
MQFGTEEHRQFYLGLAGVQLWYARQPQPGAAPSPEFDFGSTDAIAHETPAEPVVEPATERKIVPQQLERVKGLIATPAPVSGANPEDSGRSTDSAARPVAPSVAKTQAEMGPILDPAKSEQLTPALPVVSASLSAHWGIWFGESFVLISTLSSDTSDQLQSALAANIVKAMGDRIQSTGIIQWPVFNNVNVPGNDNRGFHGLLQEQSRSFAGKQVIALGLMPDEPAEARLTWLSQSLGSLSVDLPFGLASLATAPARKRQLWENIKPLLVSRR